MLAKGKAQNQALYRELAPHTFRQVLRYILEALFFVLVGLFLAWRPIQISRLTRDIGQLQKMKAQTMEINARLKLEKATLIGLERVEKKARLECGFIDPDRKQIIDFCIKNYSFHPL